MEAATVNITIVVATAIVVARAYWGHKASVIGRAVDTATKVATTSY